jgi:hypothetical protein
MKKQKGSGILKYFESKKKKEEDKGASSKQSRGNRYVHWYSSSKNICMLLNYW